MTKPIFREEYRAEGQFNDDNLYKKHSDLCYPFTEEERGNEELMYFATRSLQALINREEQVGDVKSDLRLFCRMDIGVLKNSESQYNYFINGLSRTLNTTMFMTGGNAQLVDRGKVICREFVRHLPAFLDDKTQPE